MKILGISGSLFYEKNHDCSAALLIDGKLVGNYEEERFNRIKHSFDVQFPTISVKKLLQENNLTINDIDIIAIPFDERIEEKYVKEIIKNIDDSSTHEPKLFYKDHHYGHLCDSFYQSGFNSACGIVIDGCGDNRDSVTIAKMSNNKIDILRKFSINQSIGVLYFAATKFYSGLGMFGEGKLMGLAPYGLPSNKIPMYWKDNDIIVDLPLNSELNELNLLEPLLISYFKKNIFPYHPSNGKDDNDIFYYINFAASIQKTYNDICMGIIKYAKELTDEDNLILSGGCIQNCIGNNLIVESGLFKNVFAGPAPHDAGCGAGLAFHAALEYGEKIENKRLLNSYVGKTYNDNEILEASKDYVIEDYNEDKLASMIKSGKVFGWFQGGSEIGPRALGHRSIIGNPSDRNNLNIINNTIKHRENWRPLAPTIPSELFDKVFDTNSYDLTEFMLRTIEIKPEYRKKLAAVCHIDNTTRPQRLIRNINPEFYDLIMKFYKISNIPCVINTSFNDKGEPIVETPKEAIEFMKKTQNLYGVVFNSKYIVYNK